MRLFEGTPFDRPPRCEACGALEPECQCPPEPPPRLDPKSQTARVAVEKRKHGRLMTVVRGLSAEGNDLPALLKRLKTACGAGGSLDGDALELQGDHAERVRRELTAIGYKVK